MTTFYDRKRELENKLSDAAIGLAVAQQNVATLQKRLDNLGAEYKAVKEFIANEEQAAQAAEDDAAERRYNRGRSQTEMDNADYERAVMPREI